MTSGAGWRVNSEDNFEVQFSVSESGDYTFIPIIAASSSDVNIAIVLTNSSSSVAYSIPAPSLAEWNTVLFLKSQSVYTVSVSVDSAGSVLVVEDLLFLPLESASISQGRSALEALYAQCVPYNINLAGQCALASDISASFTQTPTG